MSDPEKVQLSRRWRTTCSTKEKATHFPEEEEIQRRGCERLDIAVQVRLRRHYLCSYGSYRRYQLYQQAMFPSFIGLLPQRNE